MATMRTPRDQEMRPATDFFEYFNDFFEYTAGDWTVTTVEAGAGDATEALATGADAIGGVLLVTNDAADNDSDFFQLLPAAEQFMFVAGKKMGFKARFKASDLTNSDIIFGLAITDTTPLDASDGIFFLKTDDAATLALKAVKNGTASAVNRADALANDTWYTIEFYYDGRDTIFAYVDGVRFGSLPITNAPDDEQLRITFGIQNGAAAAKTLSVDFVQAWQER